MSYGDKPKDYEYEQTRRGGKTLFRIFEKGSRRKTIAFCGNKEKATLVVKGLNSSLLSFQMEEIINRTTDGQ